MTWLDAYYRDEDDDPIMDFDRMKANGEKLGAYCHQNRPLASPSPATPCSTRSKPLPLAIGVRSVELD